MEKKEPIKVSLPLFITIIVLFVAIVAGVIFYMQNKKLDKQISSLKEQIENTQKEKNELQEKLNNISNVVNAEKISKNETTTNNDNNSKSFADEQVKTALANYLELQAHAGVCDLLDNLTEKGKLNYDSSKDKTKDNGEIVTTVKFSDYKNAMLNYVSEKEFEKTWTSKQYININSNGFLTKPEGGGGLRVYTIKSITKNSDSTYTAKVTSVVDDNEFFEEDEYDFSIISYNGKCVIDSINKK